MTKTQPSKLFIFLVALSALAACSTTTTNISQSYRNPGFEETVFKKVLVIGVAENQEGRQAFEDAFAKAIADEGGEAQASWTLLPQNTQLEEEQIRAALEGKNFDGVLITRLLSVDKDQEYVEPKAYSNPKTTYYAGGGGYYGRGYYGGGYYGFYGTTYATVHEPGGGVARATLVFGHGIGVENDLWRETVDSVLLLVREGIRVIEITGPWHGLRAQRGRYGGEPFFATAPLGVLDLFTAEVREMAVLIDWARRHGSPRVGLGGVSLGALVAQLALVHACYWPAACRPDAALLVTHAGQIQHTAAGGSLTKGLGLIEAMEEAGWTTEEFARWRALTDPIGEPALQAGKIVSVLASRDDVTPFVSGRKLVRDWGIPAENLFILRQGHFSLPLALLRDRRPFARFVRILTS